MFYRKKKYNKLNKLRSAESTDCIYAKRLDSSNECPRYNTKQSDGEAPVILELWEMGITNLITSLPGSLWPGVIASDRLR